MRAHASAWCVYALSQGSADWFCCRHSLPEDHPLCSISSASIPERAAHLAQLHNNLRAGESGRLANSYLRPSSEADLAPTPSHEGGSAHVFLSDSNFMQGVMSAY